MASSCRTGIKRRDKRCVSLSPSERRLAAHRESEITERKDGGML
jgi:hypothetical protein